MSNSIEIKIDGPRLTPDKFIKAAEAFFSLLQGVAHNLFQDSKSDDWVVQVESGSAVLRALPQVPRDDAINAVTCGLLSLASGIQTMPRGFTRDEVKQARNLANVIDEEGQYVRHIFVKNGAQPFSLAHEIVVTADVILSGETHVAFGSIEGFVEGMHRKEGQPFTCTVHDPVHRRSIVCSFTNAEAEETAYKAFRPPRRVLVDGMIRYAKEGHAVRIDSNAVRIFPEEHELPTLEDIHAFWKK